LTDFLTTGLSLSKSSSEPLGPVKSSQVPTDGPAVMEALSESGMYSYPLKCWSFQLYYYEITCEYLGHILSTWSVVEVVICPARLTALHSYTPASSGKASASRRTASPWGDNDIITPLCSRTGWPLWYHLMRGIGVPLTYLVKSTNN
jgi:hypothetical protein